MWAERRQCGTRAASGHARLHMPCKRSAVPRSALQASTKTCSASGSLAGPTGSAGLSVRQWTCATCGAVHERDVNAAINTRMAGVGIPLEHRRKAVPGIPWLEPCCDQEVSKRTLATLHKVCEEVSNKEIRNQFEPCDVQVSLPRRADE